MRRMPRLGATARHDLQRPARIALDAAGYGVGGLLAGVAAARGAKAVHPHGVCYRARLVIVRRTSVELAGRELGELRSHIPDRGPIAKRHGAPSSGGVETKAEIQRFARSMGSRSATGSGSHAPAGVLDLRCDRP